MAVITWDKAGEHFYETGVDHGVLYVADNGTYGKGVPWNGLSAVTESPSGADANPIYADNIKYLNLYSVEEFGATIEAYQCPVEFYECDGSATLGGAGVYVGQQSRKTFGLCYRTKVGNDVAGDDLGYKIHIIYGAKASPTDRAYNTINDSPDAQTLSWDVTTTPVNVGNGYKPTSIITIDSREADTTKLASLEGMLYGTDADEPYLPLPDEIYDLFAV